ncbi:FISUMP domain-containing protein [Fibrobacter sp. UWEL]|uniref:FISUMP domain-containing protein n=1 Tax=Fibrobacter sp. UWEL TaxID=1896209 RepID=UPI000918D8EB|nr:FISUMP domain-containing protein [Fibrobacter sp. UWEL]SHK91065.1 major paralogous domain-containing protein [Fibrobacter sp. UWEL]
MPNAMNQIAFACSALFCILFCGCAQEHLCKYDESSATLSCFEKNYKTVKVDGKVWMAENLDYYTTSSYCYSDDESNCNQYGRLYTWSAAETACPANWHLPTRAEYESFMKDSAAESRAAIPAAGFRYYQAKSVDMGVSANFWTNNEKDEVRATLITISDASYDFREYNKDIAYSVRCVMN